MLHVTDICTCCYFLGTVSKYSVFAITADKSDYALQQQVDPQIRDPEGFKDAAQHQNK